MTIGLIVKRCKELPKQWYSWCLYIVMAITTTGCGGFVDHRATTVTCVGQIVDETSAPLRNVSCRLSLMKGGIKNSEVPDQTLEFSGSYQIRESNVLFVLATFKKDGFDPVSVQYMIPDLVSLDTPGVTFEADVMLKRSLAVADLTKSGAPIELDLREGRIQVFRWKEVGSTKRWARGETQLSTATLGFPLGCSGSVAGTTPALFIDLIPDDQFLAPTVDLGEVAGKQLLAPNKMHVVLRLCGGVADGLQVHTPTYIPGLVGVFPDSTTTAPVAGYSAMVEVPTKVVVNKGNRERMYFFYRVNGIYGKAELCDFVYYAETGGLGGMFTFLTQPNGSTNLATERVEPNRR
ncbi:MAG: hypothetical protein K1X53_06930 [Candidatus Sumerlaeaceae bacterium]|nr:hypothetical protein [Candidatus Sumerlaeaceae bacterium]